ncbi:hypothetical protein NRIC_37190 [Enterococcus florum]|uniref:SpaA-like prealbumin fold domain-containing protein n=1 Tax=Enterococcus florum TaxID=2480627 RepID=A0A4P5PHM9_9ENTE|nr:SpaA isopeptide-forming pilin-related protein [Enterococcus florum]GCF95828.1 hypothetical protein NRIC_37190 [Enterococcus florum]
MSKYIVKGLSLFAVVLFFIQLLPITALSETESTTVETNRRYTLPTKSSDPLKKYANIQTNRSSSTQSSISSQTEETAAQITNEEKLEEANHSEKEETSETEEKKLEELKPASIGVQATGRDLSETSTATFKITSWDILDASKTPLTTTNKAQPNKAYDFDFTWDLEFTGSDKLQKDDFVAFPALENEEWGEWQLANTSVDQPIFVEIGGQSVTLGKWQIKVDPEDNVKKIYIIFDGDFDTYLIQKLTAIKFSIPSQSLMNYTVKAGEQNVSFGGIKKKIGFEASKLVYSNGYDFKRYVNSGNGTMQYAMTVNLPGSLELSGDRVNWTANPKTGFYQNPANPTYYWGQRATDVTGVYVEDELDPGVTVNSMLIQAMVRMPTDFPTTAEQLKKGGRPTSEIAFTSYVLDHSGDGPVYRAGLGTERDNMRPTQANSFKLLTQNAGETKAQFSTRIKKAAYQYGIYTEGSGATAVRTVMAYFGKIGRSGGTQKKISDLTVGVDGTTDRWAVPARYVKNRSGVNVQVPYFAAKAADDAIKNGFYAESQRNLLESYFTLTYGDSNYHYGQIPTYNISLMLGYPPESKSGEKTNTVKYYHKHALDGDKILPREESAKGNMTNPYAEITLNPNSAMLFKWDEDNLTKALDGFTFKLQEKDGNTWKDVKTDLVTASNIVGGITYSGTIKVDNLPNGIYRFVETKAVDGYSPELSSSWNASANAVTSEEFTISASTDGAIVHVRNKKKPTAQYQVEHHLQKTAGQAGSATDFDLKASETFYGAIDDTVTAASRHFDGYTYNPGLSFNIKSGQVKADGTLVLKLYYVIDENNYKFQIYKTDTDKQVMPSVDKSGNPIYDSNNKQKEVKFKIYKFMWKGGGATVANTPPTAANIAAGHWTYVQDATTDAYGRILAPGLDLATDTFGLVEIATYPSFILPSETEAYWIIYGKDGEISNVTAQGTDNPGVKKDHIGIDGKTYWRIVNKVGGVMPLFKSNELNQPMPSDAEKEVRFKFYEFTGTTGSAYDKGDFSNTSRWTPIDHAYGGNEYRTNFNGRFLNYEEFIAGKVYAVQETKTYPEYQFEADAYWVITTKVKSNQEGAEIANIVYTKGKDSGGVSIPVTSPGIIKPTDTNNPRPGYWYIKNLPRKKLDFSFTKVNEKGNPLGNVEFKIYGGQSGKTLQMGINDDPLSTNTYWDMSAAVQTKTSHTTTGIVKFENLSTGHYLLVETRTVDGYALPAGQWIIKVDLEAGTVSDPVSRGDPLPPAFYKKSSELYLPNYKEMKMPMAGGIGLHMIAIVGISMIGLSILLLIEKLKKHT